MKMSNFLNIREDPGTLPRVYSSSFLTILHLLRANGKLCHVVVGCENQVKIPVDYLEFFHIFLSHSAFSGPGNVKT